MMLDWQDLTGWEKFRRVALWILVGLIGAILLIVRFDNDVEGFKTFAGVAVALGTAYFILRALAAESQRRHDKQINALHDIRRRLERIERRLGEKQ